MPSMMRSATSDLEPVKPVIWRYDSWSDAKARTPSTSLPVIIPSMAFCQRSRSLAPTSILPSRGTPGTFTLPVADRVAR